MKRWLFAGALTFAMAGQGLATDLPPPAAPVPPRAPAAYIPPVSPVYNWGGIYFGLNLGYGFGTSNWSDPTDPGGTTGNFNLRGFLTGATIAANFQTDAFVFGAEADFDGSFIDGKVSSLFCSAGTQCETKNFWFSTLRARLGYMPRTWPYRPPLTIQHCRPRSMTGPAFIWAAMSAAAC